VKSQISIAIIEPVGSHGGMDYYDVSLSNALFKTIKRFYLQVN